MVWVTEKSVNGWIVKNLDTEQTFQPDQWGKVRSTSYPWGSHDKIVMLDDLREVAKDVWLELSGTHHGKNRWGTRWSHDREYLCRCFSVELNRRLGL